MTTHEILQALNEQLQPHIKPPLSIEYKHPGTNQYIQVTKPPSETNRAGMIAYIAMRDGQLMAYNGLTMITPDLSDPSLLDKLIEIISI